ncbi:MAG: ubiquinone/menaquinone biosynthesis methyltransferase, partial [Phycisphaeraceae bacterium]|nr:ubiquinone/menaquinone biosynthesis methyltransferase [Phycisphaeraceae bacterium]
GERVLDVACGTGDLALAFTDSPVERVIGIDFATGMLQRAMVKGAGVPEVSWQAGDAIHLPVANASVDVVTIAFGIRNVTDPAAAMAEFVRVLRPGGRVLVLEFSLPRNRFLRGLYQFYFRHIMPHTAGLIAGDRGGAYRYLPESVNTFIGRDEMVQMMEEAGLTEVKQWPLTLGIAVLYRGVKPVSDREPSG